MSRDVVLYIEDMLETCRRVARYTEGLDRSALVAGTMAHDAVLRNLEIRRAQSTAIEHSWLSIPHLLTPWSTRARVESVQRR